MTFDLSLSLPGEIQAQGRDAVVQGVGEDQGGRQVRGQVRRVRQGRVGNHARNFGTSRSLENHKLFIYSLETKALRYGYQ